MAALADALLAVQHRPRALQLDEDGGDEHDRQGQHQQHGAHHQVEQALDGVAQHALVEALGEDHPAGVHGIELQVAVLALEEGRLDRHATAALAHGEDDLVDLQPLGHLGEGLLGVENAVMVDEMMTPTHRHVADDLDVGRGAALGDQRFDMGGAAAGADHQHAGL